MVVTLVADPGGPDMTHGHQDKGHAVEFTETNAEVIAFPVVRR